MSFYNKTRIKSITLSTGNEVYTGLEGANIIQAYNSVGGDATITVNDTDITVLENGSIELPNISGGGYNLTAVNAPSSTISIIVYF